MNSNLDKLFSTATKWREEAIVLRHILLECNVAEEMKWGKACYVHNGKNIAIIQRMNNFLALMFFKGAALQDLDNILCEVGPNSRFAKRMEFTSVQAITNGKAFILAYIEDAIALEETGRKVMIAEELILIDELKVKLAQDSELRTAFDALTPGRQRGYNLHIGSAKQPATRLARIEKYRSKILCGKGFNER